MWDSISSSNQVEPKRRPFQFDPIYPSNSDASCQRFFIVSPRLFVADDEHFHRMKMCIFHQKKVSGIIEYISKRFFQAISCLSKRIVKQNTILYEKCSTFIGNDLNM